MLFMLKFYYIFCKRVYTNGLTENISFTLNFKRIGDLFTFISSRNNYYFITVIKVANYLTL